jgi:hypothetical protein
MFEQNAENMMLVYLMSKEQGLDEPVVICGDGAEKMMADMIVGLGKMTRDEINKRVEEHTARGETCTFTTAFSRDIAGLLLQCMSPSGFQFVQEIPEGKIGCAVVQSGGNLYGFLDKPD